MSGAARAKRPVDMVALRNRGKQELAKMQAEEHGSGFGAPEDDPSGIDLIRTAKDALESYLACDVPEVPADRMHCGAHALVMLEEGLTRLLTGSGYRLQRGRAKGHG